MLDCNHLKNEKLHITLFRGYLGSERCWGLPSFMETPSIWKSFCVAGAILLRRLHKMSCSCRGRRNILEISVVILCGTCGIFDLSHCLLDTTHSTFHTFTPHPLHLTLQTLHSTVYNLHSTLYTLYTHTLHSTLFTLHFALHTLHSTLRTLHSTLCTLHFTLYSLHFKLHSRHFTLHTLHSTLYTLHFTLYTLHSKL